MKKINILATISYIIYIYHTVSIPAHCLYVAIDMKNKMTEKIERVPFLIIIYLCINIYNLVK